MMPSFKYPPHDGSFPSWLQFRRLETGHLVTQRRALDSGLFKLAEGGLSNLLQHPTQLESFRPGLANVFIVQRAGARIVPGQLNRRHSLGQGLPDSDNIPAFGLRFQTNV